MKTVMRILSVVLALALLLSLLGGCSEKAKPANGVSPTSAGTSCTLRLLVDSAVGPLFYMPPYGSFLHQSIENVVDFYRRSHPEVTIQVEILPDTDEARNAKLQELRTEIMAGEGPDLFLLPAGSLTGPEFREMPSLFQDVEQAMRNGYFADLSDWYDDDGDLKTDELQQSIMNAGLIEEKRLILPLGFDFPLFVANQVKLDELGFDFAKSAEGDLFALYDAVFRTKEPSLAHGLAIAANPVLGHFSYIFDRETENVGLAREKLVKYLELRQKVYEQKGDFLPDFNYSNVSSYCNPQEEYDGEKALFCFDPQCNISLSFSQVSRLIDEIGIAKNEGIELTLAQARTASGKTLADVTYWGAVAASCESQQQAYELLRIFLSPEVQFQTGLGPDLPTRLKYQRQIGWPVRVKGSVQAQWQVARGTGSGERVKELMKIELTDEDLSFLFQGFDEVRFDSPLNSKINLIAQNLEYDDYPSSPEQIEKGADEILEALRYHIAES